MTLCDKKRLKFEINFKLFRRNWSDIQTKNKPFLSLQRQLNAEKYLVSPDLNFVVLIADIDEDGAK